jgi:hypothetical protein
MRELVLHQYCDDCFDAHEHKVEDPDSTAPLINVPFRGLLRIDLCGQSDKTLAQPLRDLCASLPTVTADQQEAGQPMLPLDAEVYPCPYCAFEDTRRSGLIGHLWIVHTKSGRTGKWAIPDQCPECGVTAEGNQGMSAHRATQHGFDAYEQAMKATKARGNFKWSQRYVERKGAVIPGGTKSRP